MNLLRLAGFALCLLLAHRDAVAIVPDDRFVNPVIPADFPDPDVVRLGDTYYMVTTTMHHFPGTTILQSRDLVHWSYCAQPLLQLSDADKYSLVGGRYSYAQGMWAAAMAVADGRLYLLINGNDAGAFLLSTDQPAGRWDIRRLERGYYDPGMLIEGDRVYVACGITQISLCELDRDFHFIRSTTILRDKPGLEGSHLYKIGDWYYLYATYGGWPSGQAVFRSCSVTGPYEERRLVEKVIDGRPNTVHQGALIQTPSGQWWTMLMQDLGALGRCPSLHPVRWTTDGWPVVADDGAPQNSYAVPDLPAAADTLALSDMFSAPTLGMQWQWNHNPDSARFSLAARRGHLRLYTATVTDRLLLARNTLTQRIFVQHLSQPPYHLDPHSATLGTVALRLGHMRKGDRAGIAILQDPGASLAIERTARGYELLWQQDTLRTVSDFAPAPPERCVVRPGRTIYLQARFDYGRGTCCFAYSLDNRTFHPFGGETALRFNLSIFVGARFALFNYATHRLGGYVDMDWFRQTFQRN